MAGNVAALDAFEKLYPGSITSVEGPNEVGLAPVPFNGGTSLDDEIALQSALYHAVHDDAALAGIPVLNLTLGTPTTAAYAQLGDMSGVADMGNAHIYAPYGQAPIYDWSSSLALESTPTAQEATVVTEAGVPLPRYLPISGRRRPNNSTPTSRRPTMVKGHPA